MTLSKEAVEGFWDYLIRDTNKPISQAGLVPDAPIEAVEAYEKFKETYKEAIANGFRI